MYANRCLTSPEPELAHLIKERFSPNVLPGDILEDVLFTESLVFHFLIIFCKLAECNTNVLNPSDELF